MFNFCASLNVSIRKYIKIMPFSQLESSLMFVQGYSQPIVAIKFWQCNESKIIFLWTCWWAVGVHCSAKNVIIQLPIYKYYYMTQSIHGKFYIAINLLTTKKRWLTFLIFFEVFGLVLNFHSFDINCSFFSRLLSLIFIRIEWR